MQNDKFKLSAYEFSLPKSLIAQAPVSPRDNCRLLVVSRRESTIKETNFKSIVDFFQGGDVLVLNDTKVIKARLFANKETGAKLDILLLREKQIGVWEALLRPARRARINDKLIFYDSQLTARVIATTNQGGRVLEFSPGKDLRQYLERTGKVPFPHYIKRVSEDISDYQTIYAKNEGAVAAPTAGLHFTSDIISELERRGVKIVYITLHCGLGTFRPVKAADIREHKMEPEWLEISHQAQKTINMAKKNAKRIVAVGTTAVRALEAVSFFDSKGLPKVKHFSGEINLYIVPGHKFKIVDALITNFHTPCSTNLIFVSSFAPLALIQESYTFAKSHNFRFYSFGDAMLVV